MAELLDETETPPAFFPTPAPGLTDAALNLDHDMIWARIEAYTRVRFTSRQVEWVIEGCEGEDWRPPLGLVTLYTAEKWESGAWVSTTLSDGPTGLVLPSDGTFRITAQVGSGEVPAAVTEAFRRLAEYYADTSDRAGVSSYSVNMGGAIQESYDRSPSHAAKALQNSGAADLLRPYRRLK